MWLYTAQNVVNIPVICSYTDEWICPKMPQNEERNITTGSSNKIVHLQEVLTAEFSIFSSFSRRWSWLPLHNNGFSFPESSRTRFPAKKWVDPVTKHGGTKQWTPC